MGSSSVSMRMEMAALVSFQLIPCQKQIHAPFHDWLELGLEVRAC